MDKRRMCGYEQFVSYNSDCIALVSFSKNRGVIPPKSFLNCDYVYNLYCPPSKVPILCLIYSGLKRKEQSILWVSSMAQIINAFSTSLIYLHIEFYQNYC